MTLIYRNRLEWVDWMKAIGIYLVVLGHFYFVGAKFIYVFHVPLFFLISGFLSKKESDNRVFFSKLWYNLAIPMLIMTALNMLINNFMQFYNGPFQPSNMYWFVRNVVFGMVSGFDSLWFVYTLIILKVIYQYVISLKWFYLLTFVFLLLAYTYNHTAFSGFPFFLTEPNCFLNVLTAVPFFALGIFVRDYRELIDAWKKKVVIVISMAFCLLLVICCCFYNDNVEMYRCYYGDSMVLFLLGGVAGSMMIFSLSKLLGSAPNIITIISRGTIVILGFHKLFIELVRAFFDNSAFDVVWAAVIVLLFAPVIILTDKFFPLMGGKYRVTNK